MTDGLRYLPLLLRVFVFSWFGFPGCFDGVAPNPRILRFEFVNSVQQQSVCYLVSFFLYSEFISGLDALHTVPNSGFVHTLPTEQASTTQQILFRGVMTPTLLPVRPGLHRQMLDFSECHCHCHFAAGRGEPASSTCEVSLNTGGGSRRSCCIACGGSLASCSICDKAVRRV